MKLESHIAVSSVPSVYLLYKFGFLPFLLFFVGSILIDVDHIFDYVVLNRRKFAVKKFIEACNNVELKKVLLLFHSIELLIFGIIIFKNSPFLFLFLGGFYHIIFDSFSNLRHPLGYFILYRLFVKLRTEKFIKK